MFRPHASVKFVGQLAGNVFSSMPLALSRYCTPAMRQRIATLSRAVEFDSVVCDFLAMAPNFESMSNVVLFQHNVETIIWRRHASTAPDPVRKLYFGMQARRMFNWERRMCRAAGRVIAVSPQDAAAMQKLFGVEQVSAIPTGVDVEFFRRPPQVSPRPTWSFSGRWTGCPTLTACNISFGRYCR